MLEPLSAVLVLLGLSAESEEDLVNRVLRVRLTRRSEYRRVIRAGRDTSLQKDLPPQATVKPPTKKTAGSSTIGGN